MENNIKEKSLSIDLLPAIGVEPADWYLSLIDILVKELRQHQSVYVYHSEVLENFKESLKLKKYENLYSYYTDVAKREGISIKEFFDKHSFEELGLENDYEIFLYKKGVLLSA